MNKLAPGIKRRLKQQPQQPQTYEHVLPIAISAIRRNIDEDVEINEVYIALRNRGATISYDYKKERDY